MFDRESKLLIMSILSIWTYIGWTILGLILLLYIVILPFVIKTKVARSRQKKILKEIFARHNLPVPKVTFSSSYGWPTFTITFSSETEYYAAKNRGIFEEYEKAIAGFYDHEFDPKLAVYFKVGEDL